MNPQEMIANEAEDVQLYLEIVRTQRREQMYRFYVRVRLNTIPLHYYLLLNFSFSLLF